MTQTNIRKARNILLYLYDDPPPFPYILFILAFKKCASKYSGFVTDAMHKIINLPDKFKICQPPPPLLGIKLSYPNEFSHRQHHSFILVANELFQSVIMVSWIVLKHN